MPKNVHRAANLGGTAEDIEASFYEALHNGDLEQLMACWADEDDIVCVHPGGARLVGAAAIRAAFEAMFSGGTLHATPERLRRVETLGAAVHSVLERIDLVTAEGMQRAWVVATNVYLKTAQGWRLVAHHASPSRTEVAEVTVPAPLLH
ncbi:MAG: nuclear transport factor 2 family protein [Proteobacteria bacterium]|jgi:ketosteroid isomerase-like protein|nr:nuclear transport factor 2 family protein [Pseudomonadota bacterium]